MMHTQTTSELLHHVPLFHALEPAHLKFIASASEILKLERGDNIFRQGDTVKSFYYLLNGCVKIYAMSKEGVEKVIHLAVPGESFGEAIMFLSIPAPIGTQAIEDSRVLCLPKSTIYKLLTADPRIAHLMLGGMSMRMHRLIHEIKTVALQSASQRVIGYLLQLCSDQKDTHNIILPARKMTIASLLNLAPETLSRILTKLEQQGLILVNATEIHIPDSERLRTATLV